MIVALMNVLRRSVPTDNSSLSALVPQPCSGDGNDRCDIFIYDGGAQQKPAGIKETGGAIAIQRQA